jgi:hypothetical protein
MREDALSIGCAAQNMYEVQYILDVCHRLQGGAEVVSVTEEVSTKR